MPGIATPGNFDQTTSAVTLTTSIAGAVHDMSGKPVNNARIEIIDPSSGRSLAVGYTTPTGRFEIDNLRSRDYELVASSGTIETRNHIDAGEHEVSVRLPINAPDAGSNPSAVSVTQMNVPGKARQLLDKAEQAFRRSKIDDAFGFVQKALVCYPNYAKALILRGVLRMQKGDDKDAQPDLEKAVELDRTDNMGVVALASLYNNEGQFDRAQQTLDHGSTLNPTSWQASLEMARAQIGKKDYGAAVRSLDHAAAVAPPEVTLVSLYRAQALIGLKDYKGAIGQLESFLTKSPKDGNIEQAKNVLSKLKAFTAAEQK